jgi:predicted patatin/cPLA2 family phospholipase
LALIIDYQTKNIIADGHPVSELLRNGGPGAGQKLGLVLEGGAMRGVVVAGAAAALEQLGMRDMFSAFYGVSAGAVTASYFAAGQSTWGASVFYDDLTTSEFFSWQRLRQRQGPMNLEFLFQEVLQQRKPLDTAAALAAELHVFASDVQRGQLVKWSQFPDAAALFGALRAATTMPLIAGGPYKYQGREFFDGGLHCSVPWKEALADGCTHLVVLLSRPEDSPREPLSKLERLLGGNYWAKKYPELVPAYLRRAESYNQDLRELRKFQESGGPVLVVSPPAGTMPVAGFERRRAALLSGARSGAEMVFDRLFGRTPHFYELLVPAEYRGRPLPLGAWGLGPRPIARPSGPRPWLPARTATSRQAPAGPDPHPERGWWWVD